MIYVGACFMKVPQDIKNLMIQDYLSGMSSPDVSIKYGFKTHGPCLRALREAGYQPRSLSSSARKYNVDEDFFNIIDTETKAYWLGFIIADGNVYLRNLKITLQSRDRYHLVKFLTSLQSNHPVFDFYAGKTKSGRDRYMSYINIGSIKMINDLVKYNVVENKCFSVSPCEIREDLQRHYWRGLIDGDGGFIQSKPKNRPTIQYSLVLTGNQFMLMGFSTFLEKVLNYKTVPKAKKNSFYINIHGNRVTQNVTRLLYLDAHIYLDRKMETATKIMTL